MSGDGTTKKTSSGKVDWKTFDAMTEAQRSSAAARDPDAKPLTPADFKRMTRTPQVKIIRRALGLTQEEFSRRFRIPLGTLRDWEQGAAMPDQSARGYMNELERNTDHVRAAQAPEVD